MWPLKEAINGETRHTYIPRALRPVEEYLKTQARFAHLFKPKKQQEIINMIQERVNEYWLRVMEAEGITIKLATEVK